jgi:predicted amidohydrolase YtcJ
MQSGRYSCVLFVLCLIWSCGGKPEPADLVILGGKIYTMEDQHPVVEAVAVKDSRIIFAGPALEGKNFVGDDTRVIDLAGKVMTPGFIEGHGHIMGVGYNEFELDLMAVKSYEEMVARVKEAVARAEPGEWILGRGWHQDKWDHLPENSVKGFQKK